MWCLSGLSGCGRVDCMVGYLCGVVLLDLGLVDVVVILIGCCVWFVFFDIYIVFWWYWLLCVWEGGMDNLI